MAYHAGESGAAQLQIKQLAAQYNLPVWVTGLEAPDWFDMAAKLHEAIADGRKKVRTYPEPRRTDYDVLKADLVKRGWTDADFQLFTDAAALARASPEKVCQLVHDWFAAHFEIKDADMQLRLLVETIKPVVGG